LSWPTDRRRHRRTAARKSFERRCGLVHHPGGQQTAWYRRAFTSLI